MVTIDYLIFDWGNTVMRDLMLPGAMKDWPAVEAIPGVEKALGELKPGYKLVIATSAEHSNTADMIQSLDRVNLTRYFDFFFSAKELGFRKPDPRFFVSILEQLGISADRVVSIGDKYLNDVEAAKKAGLGAILFNEDGTIGEYPCADAIIEKMNELKAAIVSISTL
ncbi:MAG: HAD family hydrolase [Bacteroidetes bacterium]|nr:HAD family hydrolase [Bacteroidota bacterium]